MSLTAGARLGPYEILTPIGSGGMGEVYRARDARLAREVAIKILPSSLATDADRLRRFEHEAQAAAALNHPNILVVYDVGAFDGQPYIVSELLDGETLRERLAAGALPARRAIEYAVQVSRGLAAAHERGIVHRDLKPENVFVDRAGHVKILDFGLAKLTEPEAAAAGATVLPTRAPDTSPGMVLGTVGYMAPEQVRGQAADHRADIFALGTVLYEMLSGQRPFRRDTAIDTMTAILKEDPPELPASEKRIPPALVRIVDRCLEKMPSQRFQAAGDLAFALEALTSTSGESKIVESTVPPRRSARVVSTIAAAVGVCAFAAGAVGAAMYLRPPAVDAPTLRFPMFAPDGWQLSLATRPGAPTPIVMAPDGRSLAFVVRARTGGDMIWIQPLDSLTPHPLAGTESVSSLFWSPDSRTLGFFADGKLKRIDAQGGPPTSICNAPGAAGGTWSRDGTIVFNGGVSSLKKVAASGGSVSDATTLAKGEGAHFRPWLLPDGRHFLYTVLAGPAVTQLPFYVGSLDSADRVRLGESSSTNVMYAQGHLLFMRDTTLMAQPFDLKRLTLTGDAFPVAEDIQSQGAEPHQGLYSVSQNGVLAYQKRFGEALSQLTWVNRSGKQIATVGEKANYSEIALSPDEKRAVVSIGLNDLWMFDLARGLRTRFTFDQSIHMSPTWSPDGERLAYTRGSIGMFAKPSDGAGAETPIQFEYSGTAGGATVVPFAWSPDGQSLLVATLRAGRSDTDIELVVPSVQRPSMPLIANTRSNEIAARFSPNGRWIAYVSDESGQNEVYVTAFDMTSGDPSHPSVKTHGKWQISTAGGTLPRWRQDSKEIFYFADRNSRMMAVTVTETASALAVGAAEVLFPVRPATIGVFGPLQRMFYDVSHDGQRFLLNAEPEETAPATAPPTTVVVNWLPPSKRQP